nr:hypothetical protein [Allorhizocola rhizosphaerae]
MRHVVRVSRGPKGRDRAVQSVLADVAVAELLLGGSVVGRQRDRPGQKPLGGLEPVGQQRDVSQLRRRVRVIRILAQQALESSFRLFESRLSQQLIRVGIGCRRGRRSQYRQYRTGADGQACSLEKPASIEILVKHAGDSTRRHVNRALRTPDDRAGHRAGAGRRRRAHGGCAR